MKRLSLVVLFLVGLFAVPTAPAQQQPLTRGTLPAGSAVARPAANAPIALVDINYIFKNHARFKQMMDEMEAEVKRAEEEVRSEQASIRTAAQALDQFKKGTPDYKSIEEELAQRSSNLSVRVNLQKKEFLQKEARIFHTVYQEVLKEVEYYAQSHGTLAVLRFNGDTADEENPEDVLRDINKAVVWSVKEIDITPFVLANLNRGAVAAPAATAGGAVNPTRQGSLPAPPRR